MSWSSAPPRPMSRTSVAWRPRDRIKGAVPRGMDASTRKCTAGSSYCQWAMVFLFHELGSESKGGPNVFRRKIVVGLNLLKGHAAREAADDDRHRCPRTANYRLAVANFRIDHDAIAHVL